MEALSSTQLVQSVPGLAGLALLLGLKHGFDADHLAAIDGMARLHASAGRPRLARASGLLFSLGHGAVVLLAALLLKDRASALPQWLDGAGACISIVFLVALGCINLQEACRPAAAAPRGLLTPWLLRSPIAQMPLAGLMTGALFAFSLDTLVGATWFGAAGSRQGGGAWVLVLAIMFCAGWWPPTRSMASGSRG